MRTAIVLLGIVLLFVSVVMAETNFGAAQLVIKAGGKGDVDFPHKKHQDTLGDCNKCHTLFPQKKGSIEELMASGKLAEKQVMNQCRDCHREMSAAGQKTGPTSCSKCHAAK